MTTGILETLTQQIEKHSEHLGRTALYFLIATLCVTPLLRLARLNVMRFRQALGLICFTYVGCHVAAWVVFDMGFLWGQMVRDVVKRPYLIFGMLALVMLVALALTSNRLSIRRMGAGWRRLHRLIYPAAVLAARSYSAQNEFRNASRVLQKTWSVRPHPSVAATYAEIVPDETPAARLRRFEDLIRQNPEHEESKLLRAELLLAAEDFPGARRALGDIPAKHPTVRSLSIRAWGTWGSPSKTSSPAPPSRPSRSAAIRAA